MTDETADIASSVQSENGMPGASRAIGMSCSVLAILAGLTLVVAPLLTGGQPWAWTPTSMDDLDGARINASLHGVGPDGLRLSRQGSRAISLISPPMSLDDSVGTIIEIEAAAPMGAPDSDEEQPARATVVLLWQTAPAPEFKYEIAETTLGTAPTVVRFSLPVAPSRLHRLGVQFPTITGEVVVRRIAFPDLSVAQRARLAVHEFSAREPFAAHSINMIRGPSILGTSLNVVLVGLAILLAGVAGFTQFLRGRRLPPHVVIACILLAWLVEDARATVNLAKNTRNDTAYFESLPSQDQRIAAAHGGYEIAWVHGLLRDHAKPGERFCLISDEDIARRHHLAYLLAPHIIHEDDCRRADYIVVILSSTTRFDPDKGILTLADQSTISATPVAQLSEYVYILRRSGA